MPRRRPAVAPPPPLRSRGAVPYVMLPPDPTTTTTTTPVPNDWLMTSPAPTAAPPRPDTGNSDDFKTPLIIFFVTLLATVVTASFFGALYWFCIRKYFQPATSRTAAAPSSNLDVQMSDRLLPPGSVSRQGARGQVVILEDNCDGDADPEYQPYLHEPDELRQRSNFLLLPEYASQAGSAQANSASGDEDDPAPASRGRLNVHYSSNNITPQRKALVEWLNVVVSAYMEAQLAGVPLDPPVAPAMTRSLSPTSGVPSDRSDVNSDAAPRGGQNPVAKRLQYLKSRTSDSSASSKTQPSTTKANINDRSPPNGRPNDASGVHSAPSPLNMSPNNSGPTAVPLSQLLEVPLHATSAAGVPLPTPDTTPTTLDPGKKQHGAVAEHHSHSTGGGATSRHSPPKSQTTPRKILHDSSSSSSDRSASHTRLNRQQHRM